MGVPADVDAGRGVRGAVRRRRRARCATRRPAARSPTARTSRSATWSPPGSATRSSTGWSSRCSAACTPATRGCCPPARPCRSWSRSGAASASLVAGRGAGRARPRPARCSPASRVAWAGCRGALAATGSTSAPTRRCASSGVPRRGFALVVGPTVAPEEVLADEVVLADPGRADRPAARRRRAGRGRRAGRRRVRLDGHRHPRLPRPRTCPTCPGSGFLVPPVDGRDDQGRDVLVRQVGLGPRGRRRPAGPAHVGRPAPRGVGRSRCPTRTWSPRRSPTCARRPAWRPDPSTAACSAGVAALPQYAVGHLDRVARIRAAVARRARARRLRGGVRRRRHPRRASPRPAGPRPTARPQAE